EPRVIRLSFQAPPHR
ncbi:ras-domain-containing protein, partial [Penicillium brevicompactum]